MPVFLNDLALREPIGGLFLVATLFDKQSVCWCVCVCPGVPHSLLLKLPRASPTLPTRRPWPRLARPKSMVPGRGFPAYEPDSSRFPLPIPGDQSMCYQPRGISSTPYTEDRYNHYALTHLQMLCNLDPVTKLYKAQYHPGSLIRSRNLGTSLFFKPASFNRA
jgi:hypothetical protein